MKRLIIMLGTFASILLFCVTAGYTMVAIIDPGRVPYDYLSGVITIFSTSFLVMMFIVSARYDKNCRIKREKEHFDKYLNPDTADILRFSRKNEAVKICKFNKSGISLAFIDERIWCAFEKRDGKILLFHPPELEPHQINTKCIEVVKVENLPRIS